MISTEAAIGNRRQKLEYLFFQKEDERLIAELKTLKKMKETKANLAKVSGIQDDVLLQRLVELDVQPQTLATLTVIPLIEVAWADGDVDEEERTAILTALDNAGFARGGVDYALIQVWLEKRPESGMLTAWKHLVHGLCQQMSAAQRHAFKKEIMDHATLVAQASGGFMGLASISEEEGQMLERLEAAFILKK